MLAVQSCAYNNSHSHGNHNNHGRTPLWTAQHSSDDIRRLILQTHGQICANEGIDIHPLEPCFRTEVGLEATARLW